MKEGKKINSLKSQIDLYKKQVHELHENLLTQEMKVKKYEFENRRYEERLNIVSQEKERLTSELNSLKETNEELQIMNEMSSEATNNKVDLSNMKATHELSNYNFSELELLSMPIELKFVKSLLFIHS